MINVLPFFKKSGIILGKVLDLYKNIQSFKIA
jgi:hypothetical protein